MKSAEAGSGTGDAEELAREIAETIAAVSTPLPMSSAGGRPGGGSGSGGIVGSATGGPGGVGSVVPGLDLSGPRELLDRGARFVSPVLPPGASLHAAKKLILRALRIVTRDQATFNSAVVESLRTAYREVEEGVTRSTGDSAARVEGVRAELEGRLSVLRDEVDAAARTTAASLAAELSRSHAGLAGEISRVHGVVAGEIRSAAEAVRSETETLRQALELQSARVERLETALRLMKLEWSSLRTRLSGASPAAPAFAAGDVAGPKGGRLDERPTQPPPQAAAGSGVHAGLYAEFEEAFRGSEEEIARRQRSDAARFAGAPGPVADLGCGRGEFLQCLAELGVAGIGVDSNPVLAARVREKGLPIEERDLLEWLRARPEGSLGGITAFQVVEHLPPAAVVELVELAASRLAPGGRLLLETVNPESVYAMRWFWADLTHVRPVPGPTLAQLFRSAGLRDVAIDYRAPVPADKGLRAGFDPSLAPVDELLFGPQDVAVTGVR